jgi:hypothetical protein
MISATILIKAITDINGYKYSTFPRNTCTFIPNIPLTAAYGDNKILSIV